MKSISKDELKAHGTEDSTWLCINSNVYDVTKFAMAHPGGEAILTEWGGKDATGATVS